MPEPRGLQTDAGDSAGVAQGGVRAKELSAWQLARVRDALRAYKEQGDRIAGVAFTWRDVREAILESTGVAIGASVKYGAERLRQFVEGVAPRKGDVESDERQYPVPQADALQAIVDFVIDPDQELLRPEELERDLPGAQAALRLAAYFCDGNQLESSIAVPDLAGFYTGRQESADHQEQARFTLRASLDARVLEVTEVRQIIDTTPGRYTGPAIRPGRTARTARQVYHGWAVPMPEDNLMLLMKEESSGRNFVYVSLSDVGLWQRQRKDHHGLYFVRQEFGTTLTRALHLAEQPDSFRLTLYRHLDRRLCWLCAAAGDEESVSLAGTS